MKSAESQERTHVKPAMFSHWNVEEALHRIHLVKLVGDRKHEFSPQMVAYIPGKPRLVNHNLARFIGLP